MEVNLNSSVNSITSKYVSRAGAPKPEQTDNASFSASESLNKELQDSPDVRPDAVERARGLVADTKYPPQETIDKIANLLAFEIQTPFDR